MTSDDLRQAMQTSPTLQPFLLRYAQAFMIQTAHTALANGRAKIHERLARWLLMAHDRIDGDQLALVHEFLALMLGVRREGVTIALQELEGEGLIRTTRGNITIVDRKGLEKTADGSYGVPEAEFDRLIGGRRLAPFKLTDRNDQREPGAAIVLNSQFAAELKGRGLHDREAKTVALPWSEKPSGNPRPPSETESSKRSSPILMAGYLHRAAVLAVIGVLAGIQNEFVHGDGETYRLVAGHLDGLRLDLASEASAGAEFRASSSRKRPKSTCRIARVS